MLHVADRRVSVAQSTPLPFDNDTITLSKDTLIELFAHMIVLLSARVTIQLQITLHNNWRSSSQTLCNVTTGDSEVL